MPLTSPVADQCQGQWNIDLFSTITQRFTATLYGTSCICCAAYQQRSELLEITGEPYICFGGLCPLGPLRNPQGPSWLAIESVLCPCCALNANRYIIQTRFDKANTAADNFLLTATCLCTSLVKLIHYVKDVPELDTCVPLANMFLAGCMYAQQQLEIDEIKQNGYYGPSDSIYDFLPPMQQEMIQLGKPMGAGTALSGEAMGAEGVVPAADPSKTQFEAPPPGAKDEDAYDARRPLFSLCNFWPSARNMGQNVL